MTADTPDATIPAGTGLQRPVRSEWISVPVDSRPMSAYLARTADATPQGVVLVGFEMFGLSRYIRSVTDRIAGLGYTAVAPDFYHHHGDRIDLPETTEPPPCCSTPQPPA